MLAIPGVTSADGTFGIVTVVPKSGPSDEATQQLVHDLRDQSSALGEKVGATIAVTGLTAAAIDVSDKLARALPVYLIIVVGLALVLLLLIFRSIVVPVVAALGFLLTIGVSFGAVVAVYQWGWLSGIFGVDTPAPIISFLPILLIGVLFGLAMDYQVFMVSGMRESYVHGARGEEGRGQRLVGRRPSGHGGRRSSWRRCSLASSWHPTRSSPRSDSRSASACWSTPLWSG